MPLNKPRDIPDHEDEMSCEDIQTIINMIDSGSAKLNYNSQEFVDQMRDRADTYATVRISEKQYNWLVSLIQE